MSDVARRNKLYCANNNIQWDAAHDKCLEAAMIDFYCNGIWPVIKEILGLEDKIVIKDK